MKKISFDLWKTSMSFLIDDKFDKDFLNSIAKITEFINGKCTQFSNPKDLSEFLTINDSFDTVTKLKAFVSLIGLSEERLKRVVSLIRFRLMQESFRTEWDVKIISKVLEKDDYFKSLLVDFFINGRNSIVGEFIPMYYMRNFNLKNETFIKNLKDFHYVERILNDNEIQGKYSNKIGAHVELFIQMQLDLFIKNINPKLSYEKQKEFPLLNKNIDFLIPSVKSPIVLIESSYNITTGSGQSKRADQLVEIYSTLMRHNANQKVNKIIIINFCDGFGWVGRQNDLKRIYDSSDYVINQHTLYVLPQILQEFYPKV